MRSYIIGSGGAMKLKKKTHPADYVILALFVLSIPLIVWVS